MISTRNELIEYCLRRLGFPVTEVNLDPDQIEDRVDDAFQIYEDYHFDGTEKQYYVHQVTSADVTNKYIPVPDSLIFITRVLESDTLFSLDTPMGDPKLTWDTNIMNPLGSSTGHAVSSVNDHAGGDGGFGLTDYFLTMSNISLMKYILGGNDIPIRFNRHTNRLYIDIDWENDLREGHYIIVEGSAKLDPDEFTDVYNDRWIKKYLTAGLKQQYGTNLAKFDGIALPGGVTLDGNRIYSEASEELLRLEEELQEKYEIPPMPFMG